MVDLPREVLASAFNASLTRGSILRLQDYPLPTQKRDKFFLVANLDCTEPRVYHFLTTSKVARFRSLPWGHREGILVPPGTFPRMPLETIIDCHTHMIMDRTALLETYCTQECDIVGVLPSGLLRQADKIITASRTIPLDVKRRILPGAV